MRDYSGRVKYFAERPVGAAQAGNLFVQVRQCTLGREYIKYGSVLSIHLDGHAIAPDKDDLCDRNIATLIRLRSILDAVKFPVVFKNDHRSLFSSIERIIEQPSILKSK